ncbi:uncharacterized protein LOC132703705 [Cylas formicarius]|uniref:uncharacterized protein LOC132703705 n=1 Tax=Cylas formicarius TaxID=197179 RepID=UPI002958D635|nr:uncharacterized protein LOC132703705 [Cylas formicarius]
MCKVKDLQKKKCEDLDSQFNEREVFQTEFYHIVAKAKNILGDFNDTNNKNGCLQKITHSDSNSVIFQENLRPNSNETMGVRLPLINLPTFAGNYSKWLEFRDTFDSLIHKNKSIGDIQKFHYLRASLETLENNSRTKLKENFIGQKQRVFVAGVEKSKCVICKSGHDISECKKFLELTTSQRIAQIKRNKLCMCCFSNKHFSFNCQGKKCSPCGLGHDVLLHFYNQRQTEQGSVESAPIADVQKAVEASSKEGSKTSVVLSSRNCGTQGQVLLSTTIVKLKDVSGNLHHSKVLLDSASMSNFITEKMCDKLQLKTKDANVCVVGIGQNTEKISKRCKVEISSQKGDFLIPISCLIILKISDEIPLCEIELGPINIPGNICLANSEFHLPDEVDMLIGAGVFWKLITHNKPFLQNTWLGWVVAGYISGQGSRVKPKKTVCNLSIGTEVQDQMAKFWELEEPGGGQIEGMTRDEVDCENFFVSTKRRDQDGRFVVAIPLKIIQEDIISILLRFRQHEVAFCANIAKMYRQVWVREDQRHLQRILWRENPAEEVKVYNLNTVTFGLTSSPFLAVRCLQELTKNCEQTQISKVIGKDFYVDNLISGASSIQEALQICKGVCEVLKSGGFELRKFSSNKEEFLEQFGVRPKAEL